MRGDPLPGRGGPEARRGRAHGRGARRAQSEVVGVVLLVGVFAVVALIVGTVVVSNVLDQAGDEPLLDANVTATADNVTLVHAGGDGLELGDVTVVVRRDSESTFGLASFSELDGDGDARFEPGERRRRPHGFGAGTLEVLVVHKPSNAVVYRETVDAE